MAKSINVSTEINAPICKVWEEVSNINNHSTWMEDAEYIEFLSKQVEKLLMDVEKLKDKIRKNGSYD